MLKKKIWANFQRIIELFTQGSGIRDPRSGIRKKPTPDPGVKKAPDPGSATLLFLFARSYEISFENFNFLIRNTESFTQATCGTRERSVRDGKGW
jgi:hypothetical protein